jgi:hypothetical protein
MKFQVNIDTEEVWKTLWPFIKVGIVGLLLMWTGRIFIDLFYIPHDESKWMGMVVMPMFMAGILFSGYVQKIFKE